MVRVHMRHGPDIQPLRGPSVEGDSYILETNYVAVFKGPQEAYEEKYIIPNDNVALIVIS